MIGKLIGLLNNKRETSGNKIRLDNIFHCCVQKTGSQWIKAIFSDKRIIGTTGLKVYSYQKSMPGGCDERRLTDRSFDKPFPRRTVVSPLYIDYENYRNIQKPNDYRTIFIMRDPRDIVVSWYYSMKYSHHPMGKISEIREILNASDKTAGLLYAIGYLDKDLDVFRALGSWHHALGDAPVILVKYENLISRESHEAFSVLFEHCGINLPQDTFMNVMSEYSFKGMSKRDPGQEDKRTHLRKGISGDWKNHFDDDVKDFFKKKTGDLVVELGYEEDAAW